MILCTAIVGPPNNDVVAVFDDLVVLGHTLALKDHVGPLLGAICCSGQDNRDAKLVMARGSQGGCPLTSVRHFINLHRRLDKKSDMLTACGQIFGHAGRKLHDLGLHVLRQVPKVFWRTQRSSQTLMFACHLP